MKLDQIEDRLAQVDLAAGQDLIYELLSAFGTPQSSITKLRSGTYNKSGDGDTVLWKKKVWDTYSSSADNDQLLLLLDRAQADTGISKLKPRFYIARNQTRIAAVDNRLGQSLDIDLTELKRHAAFFMPWAGAEKVRSETASYVDTKVAQQMAKLYDEIIATNPDVPATGDGRRDLNVFFSRLLFCFFAEDTGVFPDGMFTDAVNNLTATDGSDTASFLDQLFVILDTAYEKRIGVPSHFEPFGYVNGSLFSGRINAPVFSRKARNIVVDCGTLDWSSINPDIFGSMIQAVTAGADRSNLGMHYTSVENILKVLNPLLLDDLEERFDSAEDSVPRLEALLGHLSEIKVFDPACGSGNFLIVAYKRLRTLEHRILQRLVDLQGGEAPLFAESRIWLKNFYGIEIDDFAHDIAKLSLWFAKHQMNIVYDELFGIERPLIPLTESGAIVRANATRTDWTALCEPDATTYVCGNPPYLGSSLLDDSQKADFAKYFDGQKYSRELDYVSLWFLKGADYVEGSSARLGFVSTNSICQGQHVALLWPSILERGIEIAFAHTSFLWSNSAVGGAGVTCIVVGLCTDTPAMRRLFSGADVRRVSNINPYLAASEDNTVIVKVRKPLSDVPAMTNGSKPTDNGNLLLDRRTRDELVLSDAGAKPYLRPFVGASELIDGVNRYCLLIADDEAAQAREVSEIRRRLEAVRAFRLQSKDAGTRRDAERPQRYGRMRHLDAPCIAVPRVTSERRDYIPIGLFPSGTVLSDRVFAIYEARPWLFALLHSSMHVVWVAAVCGRMRTDYNYSNTLGYNTFAFPGLNDASRAQLSDRAMGILAARERWPDRSLAELYDPDKMPANLRFAHEANDAYVDGLYRSKPFGSDADRMELLLALYRDLVAEQDETKSKKKG